MNLTQRLEEIALRLEKATPGPWKVLEDDVSVGQVNAPYGWYLADFNFTHGRPQCNANASLAANAPADLALLLRIVEAQDAALEKLGIYVYGNTLGTSRIARECRERVRQMCEGAE